MAIIAPAAAPITTGSWLLARLGFLAAARKTEARYVSARFRNLAAGRNSNANRRNMAISPTYGILSPPYQTAAR